MSSSFIPLGSIRREGEVVPVDDTLRFRVSGMHCASCVGRVEQAMAGVPGVLAARVNLATQRAEADVARAMDASVLTAAIRSAGYDAFLVTSPIADDRELRERDAETRAVRQRFALALACGVCVFVIAHVGMLMPGVLPGTLWQQAFAQFVLALPVQFVAGWPFLLGLVRGVGRRAPDMDTLVGLGTLTAFGYS